MKPEELEYFARKCRHKNLNPQPVLDHIAGQAEVIAKQEALIAEQTATIKESAEQIAQWNSAKKEKE